MVCIYMYVHARTRIHTAWASVLLFGTKGNTRASECGTARLQSRFFIAPHAIKAEHYKADDRFFAYVLIFDIVDLPHY